MRGVYSIVSRLAELGKKGANARHRVLRESGQQGHNKNKPIDEIIEKLHLIKAKLQLRHTEAQGGLTGSEYREFQTLLSDVKEIKNT